MQIPLLEGRVFADTDTRTTQRVVIVDQHMADQLWPGQSPLGKRVKVGNNAASAWLTVVGVVGRVKQYTLDTDSRMAMYFPHPQYPTRAMNVVVRTAGDPAAATEAVTRAVRTLDSELPIYGLRTMEARVADSLARRRFAMLLLTLFAALAFGLATIGIYGVMAYLVHQGTRELGIRIALGATPRGILGMILRHGLGLAMAGVSVGIVAALVLTRFMEGLLFGIGAADPLTFVSIPLVLAVTTLVACYVPACRAATTDPVVALRAE